MPLWNLIFKTGAADRPQDRREAVEKSAAGGEALRRGEEPQNSPVIGELLALLWRKELVTLLIARETLILSRPSPGQTSLPLAAQQWLYRNTVIELIAKSRRRLRHLPAAYFIQELSETLRQQCSCPASTQERYAAVAAGLCQSLRHNLQELRLSDEVFPINYLADSLRICRTLRVAEAHAVCCELLVVAARITHVEGDGPRVVALENLRRDIRGFLNELPPEQTPVLWQMLNDSKTSAEFWPVIAEMRSPAVVPYLLAALLTVSDVGKEHVIVTLQNIRDARAVPALQTLARDKTSPVASLAEAAAAFILRHSASDVAQLLRASDSQFAGQAGDTLLRPVEATTMETRPEELLRPR